MEIRFSISWGCLLLFDTLYVEKEPGTEEILDGVLYSYTNVYGLLTAERVYELNKLLEQEFSDSGRFPVHP